MINTMGVPAVYVETSVISYLTSRPSRDLLIAARQEATREWWDLRDTSFKPFVSKLVFQEASAGDPVAAYNRLRLCQPLPLLAIEDDCQSLANALIAAKLIPATEQEDALHIALATVAKVDFVATWNFSHLVGPVIKFRLQTQIQAMGFSPPILATPEE